MAKIDWLNEMRKCLHWHCSELTEKEAMEMKRAYILEWMKAWNNYHIAARSGRKAKPNRPIKSKPAPKNGIDMVPKLRKYNR